MSALRTAGERSVVAVVTADLHFSHNRPIARAGDWYKTMGRYIDQLNQIAAGLPVLVAGDVLHRWNEPAELINFLISNLRCDLYAVPGNHDLPYHDYNQIYKSAYWTLVEAAKIKNVDCRLELPGRIPLSVTPSPHGCSIEPIIPHDLCLEIALIHKYICGSGGEFGYPAASQKTWADSLAWTAKLTGFDVAVFGDNHIPFEGKAGKCNVFNCGTLIPRRADEIGLRPSVGLLYSDGSIVRHYLDTGQDEWIGDRVIDTMKAINIDLDELTDDLVSLTNTQVDVAETIIRAMEKANISLDAQRIITKAMEIRK